MSPHNGSQLTPKQLSAANHNNHGHSLYKEGRYGAAIKSYKQAIAIDPDYAAGAFFNLAVAELLLGNFEEGWKRYEKRWLRTDHPSRTFSKPLWLGAESLAGKTILLHAEQGYGDTIQFCRYAALAANRGATVVLEVQEPLVGLIRSLPITCSVIAQGERLPDFDFQCPLMSLPLAFRTSLDNIPADVPYLHPDVENRRVWRRRLGKKSRARVGLCWSGAPGHHNDRNRSIPAHLLTTLLEQDCDYHSVQKGIREEDLAFLTASKVIPHDNHVHNFLDTASLVSEMDVIICVDTAVAHLAGALGKPVWILLPFVPDFRWLLEREDSPWYPTARLFRQDAPGNWTSVFTAVTADLTRLSNRVKSSLESLAEAQVMHKDGNLSAAERLYRQAICSTPESAEALNLLGVLQIQQRHLDDGLKLIQSALLIEPDYAEAHYNCGLVLQTLNRHDAALAHYDRAIAADPHYAEAYNNRGIALQYLGQYNEAILSFDAALKIRPGYEAAAGNRSRLIAKNA